MEPTKLEREKWKRRDKGEDMFIIRTSTADKNERKEIQKGSCGMVLSLWNRGGGWKVSYPDLKKNKAKLIEETSATYLTLVQQHLAAQTNKVVVFSNILGKLISRNPGVIHNLVVVNLDIVLHVNGMIKERLGTIKFAA